MSHDLIAPTDEASFARDVLAAPRPVLVEVGARWCPPCRALEPHLRALASRHADALRVVALDADDAPDLAARLGVRGLPTVILYVDGREVARQVGLVPAARLDALVAPHVARS